MNLTYILEQAWNRLPGTLGPYGETVTTIELGEVPNKGVECTERKDLYSELVYSCKNKQIWIKYMYV